MHRATHHVVAGRSGPDRRHDLGHLEDFAIRELDILDTLVAAEQHVRAQRHHRRELPGNTDRLASRRHRDQEVIVGSGEGDVISSEERKPNSVTGRTGFFIINDYVADHPVEDIDILAGAAVQRVVSTTRHIYRGVGCTAPRQRISSACSNAKVIDAERSYQRLKIKGLINPVHRGQQLRRYEIIAYDIVVEADHALGHGAEQGRPVLPLGKRCDRIAWQVSEQVSIEITERCGASGHEQVKVCPVLNACEDVRKWSLDNQSQRQPRDLVGPEILHFRQVRQFNRARPIARHQFVSTVLLEKGEFANVEAIRANRIGGDIAHTRPSIEDRFRVRLQIFEIAGGILDEVGDQCLQRRIARHCDAQILDLAETTKLRQQGYARAHGRIAEPARRGLTDVEGDVSDGAGRSVRSGE